MNRKDHSPYLRPPMDTGPADRINPQHRLQHLDRELEQLATKHAQVLRDHDSVAARFAELRSAIVPTGRNELELRTLGDVKVALNALPVQFPFARCRELIVWLALHGPNPREKIVDALWDGSRVRSHLEYFRVVVRRARHALRAAGAAFDPIVYKAGLYRLAPQFTLSSDAALLESARQSSSTAHWHAALEAYRGDFLPQTTTEWAALERTRLLDAAVEVALRLAERLERDDPRGALAAYRRAVQLEPLSDPSHAGIVRVCENLGEFAAARIAREVRRKLLAVDD